MISISRAVFRWPLLMTTAVPLVLGTLIWVGPLRAQQPVTITVKDYVTVKDHTAIMEAALRNRAELRAALKLSPGAAPSAEKALHAMLENGKIDAATKDRIRKVLAVLPRFEAAKSRISPSKKKILDAIAREIGYPKTPAAMLAVLAKIKKSGRYKDRWVTAGLDLATAIVKDGSKTIYDKFWVGQWHNGGPGYDEGPDGPCTSFLCSALDGDVAGARIGTMICEGEGWEYGTQYACGAGLAVTGSILGALNPP